MSCVVKLKRSFGGDLRTDAGAFGHVAALSGDEVENRDGRDGAEDGTGIELNSLREPTQNLSHLLGLLVLQSNDGVVQLDGLSGLDEQGGAGIRTAMDNALDSSTVLGLEREDITVIVK